MSVTMITESIPMLERCGLTYARARLLLGISCVGTYVVLSIMSLSLGIPEWLSGIARGPWIGGATVAIAAYVLLYAVIHLPFDFLGGYLLPVHFKREHRTLRGFTISLSIGIAIHTLVLFAALLLVHAFSAWFGLFGTVVAVLTGAAALLAARTRLALGMGGLVNREHDFAGVAGDGFNVRMISARDEGWTGGIEGVCRPRALLMPSRWHDALTDEESMLSIKRRVLAIRTGAWIRGRVAAIGFVILGAVLAGILTGSNALGTAAGTIEFSLWYTLWSFLGLLVLPTPSRAAVYRVDEALRAGFTDAAEHSSDAVLLEHLDTLADDEPSRPAVIEAIFHPIPSVSRRAEGTRANARVPDWWDAARSAVFMGTAAGSLLGRAVHCNCGRPALWVYLPSP